MRPACTCGHTLLDHCDDGARGYCINEGCDCDAYEATRVTRKETPMLTILAVLLTIPTTSSAWELRIATSGAGPDTIAGYSTYEACIERLGDPMFFSAMLPEAGETFVMACVPVHPLRPYHRSHR